MLKGRTALVTGSTAGIGLAVARRLAADGCNIVLNGIAAPEDAEAILGELGAGGVEALFDGADLQDGAGADALVAGAVERFGRVDIVVNNAVTRVFGPIEDCSAEDWNRVIAVNLNSAFHTIRGTLPGMRRRNWGRIVNMSSVYGLKGAPDRASYVTTKTALIGLTRAVALETVGSDITCNAVCPGSVNTTRSAEVIARAMAEEGLSEAEATARFLAGKQPSARFVAAESVADLVVFLCGPGGRDISGAVLPVDLAWTAS